MGDTAETLSTPSAVRRLDDRLIDKIAAGEVVERPASVVKELVENALDAGARAIEVTIEGGGTGLIRIADDGHGIAPDELPLAIARHCTSKLFDAAGLAAITTMGFRGEALPSIGAVARLTLTSRHRSADAAARIVVEGGRAGPVEPAGRAVGTTVEVRDLFYATPARLKFLKSDRTEATAIGDTVRRLALSAPHVAFTLSMGGRATRYQPGTPQSRAREVLGAEFAEEAVALAAERSGVRLTGQLGLPTNGRSTSQHQYAFVNGRVVRDKLITQALRAGYQDVMARDRQPMAVVFIEIDPANVDVNVHPAKADVRFRDAQAVRGLIVSAIRRQLAEAAPRSSRSVANAAIAALSNRPREWQPAFAIDAAIDASGDTPEGLAEDGASWTLREGAADAAGEGADTRAGLNEGVRREAWRAPARRASFPPIARTFVRPPSPASETPTPSGPTEAAGVPSDHPLGAAVAQVHGNYIVAQTADGVAIIDQHAAHERIVYEALKKAAASKAPPSQGLLIPDVVELDPDDVAALGDHAEALARFGLVLEPFGPGAVVVRETPAALGTFDVAGLVRELADEITEWGAAGALEARLDHVAATMACHGSVRSGRALRPEEMNALLRQIEATPSAGQCNHGRPTFVALSLAEIERLFERR
ncbi:DNA mismatch repair endonuclease MutL [Acuticoccus sp. M5D2P5]|uniref:DNA mismatch repair endonuclease MutL n=1 Tax=Acuticoccus kalidii TaxID=2910977 RepID=UPI001F2BD4D0|nr:DNA mismatch repair endonuclease MutL [Acuticoccus kalidii]MCF3933500.1 DNA mismatch repair endonuclease MutL [Acuticoccus kalidii]